MKTLVKIYVGTYAKYNAGSLVGEWINLPMDKANLRRILRKIAGGERDPEYMIQDTEVCSGMDFRAIGESEDIFALNEELADLRLQVNIAAKSPAVAEAIEEYRRVWGKDRGMMEYCAEKISDVYRTESGYLVEFDVPTIETHFCFAEDYNGAYCEELSEWARDMAYNVSRTERYFIRENMERAFGDDDKLLADGMACGRIHGYDVPKFRVAEVVSRESFERINDPKYKIDFTSADVAGILAMLNAEKEKFLKRLRRWWKRYGADGLRTWTYYSD